MSWIRSERNASTELRLVALLRAGGITGWRRGCRLCLRGQTTDNGRRKPDGGGRTADGGVRMAAERQRNASGVGKDSPPGARRQDLRGQSGSSSAHSLHSVVQIRRPSSAVCRPLTVRPDFVFRREQLAVFVDGCFWHGCPRHFTRPKARRAFWDAKIAANRARDRRIDRALRASGWHVLHVWEHALAPRQLGRTLARVRRVMQKRSPRVPGNR